MKKINLLTIVLITILLSSCVGYYQPRPRLYYNYPYYGYEYHGHLHHGNVHYVNYGRRR